ncbi:NAD(P)H-dependent glycerol-3-phosphate dehydrogenase [Jannaschia seohaensis]|uniref:Glycerol-3-phosphate dehydrogenase [NAD(P)+] n=1 Tax=Jannaschia seohaensis TaxID=475081 RepID=A0A2Y9C3P4_9RHOB|nr:NAD(P)H-dependent glycerol-3-phosphate dehydrogenase [Jannaschia seohaensis]PWJ21895.1 glycerol-3-phosphate dehydrogenase (NAD(P)+) [Jannaschia seohaensis]SSA38173.1 glycerol-3-phosphate dehydrogenase (NAD(P)+) [Jannaschia seohaensis]
MKHHPISGHTPPNPAHKYERVAVIGAGSWGTALAATLAQSGVSVRLWGRNSSVVDAINREHRNEEMLPGVDLPETLHAVREMAGALANADAALIVVPSRSIRSVSRQVAEHAPAGIPIAVCAKGIEAETGLLMSQVAEEELPGHPIGCVSGPTFARETALGHPTSATVAFPFTYADRLSPQDSPAVRMAVSLSTESFRAYVSDDLVGVEIGGAVKNVIAIACGMMTGAGFAENTRAALITRGVDEMKVLAEALGGRRETVTGLSGIGDLCLTCSSPTSRNMSLGQQLGQGISRADCFDGRPVVVEGEVNARSVTDLARRLGVSMPICETVRHILHDGADLGAAFAALWARPLEAEPRAMDLAFSHPATDQAIATLAERIS